MAAGAVCYTLSMKIAGRTVKFKQTGSLNGNLLAGLRGKLTNWRYLGPVLVVIAALLWSLDGILRAELRAIPPAFLVFLEHGIGLIFMLPWLITLRSQILKASGAAKVSLIVTSIISGTLGTIFYTAALAQIFYVPFSVVVLMQQLQPIFAVGLSSLLLKEKISGQLIVNAIFALVGAYLLSFPSLLPDLKSAPGIAQALAASLALAAAIAWGTGTVFSKFALKEISPRAATAGRFAITTVASLILAIFLGQTIPLSSINGSQLLQLLVIVFSAGAMALFIYYQGLSRTKAQVSTFAELAWPISAFAIDLARGISFAPTQLIGALLLIVMIIRIARANSK